MNPAKHKLHLGLRKMIKIRRRFKVEHLGDGVIKWTCLTCGHATTDALYKESPQLADKWVRYVMSPDGKGSGTGICDRCTRQARDERYPLRDKEGS